MTWKPYYEALNVAIDQGMIVDYRSRLPRHKRKKFRRREAPTDVLGTCSHCNGSANQNVLATARYHVGQNHVSETGCPGILYTWAISDKDEPDSIMLCNDVEACPWAQGKGSRPKHPEWSGDENRHLMAILVMGLKPSESQMRRHQWLVAWLQQLFGFDGRGVFGHYHFGKRSCPQRPVQNAIESMRATAGGPSLDAALDWQRALLANDPSCLPWYGADGIWGMESRRALIRFEQKHRHRVDGTRDPFAELLLLRHSSTASFS